MSWWNLALCFWLLLHQGITQSVFDFLDDPHSIDIPILHLDTLQLTLSSKILLDIRSPRADMLNGYLGWVPDKINSSYSICSEENSLEDSICLRYSLKDMKLLVTQDNSDTCEIDSMTCHTVGCHRIQWTNHIGGSMDCFNLGEDEWYGLGDPINTSWPIQGDSRPWFAAVTGDPLHHSSGGIIENLWLSSKGFIIHVDDDVPLFVSFNESGNGKLCLTTSSKRHPYEVEVKVKQNLSYSICSAASVKEAWLFSAHRWFKEPRGIPEDRVFINPIWSSWARFKSQINADVILKYAEEIKSLNFPASQLEIDDKWEDCYGNLDFDLTKFPDPKRMVEELGKMKFPTTLWVHPFCNRECDMFKVGERDGYWVKDNKGGTLEVTWWNGVSSGLLDVTNKEAVDWFVKRLRTLQVKYNITSFKFDAGEVLWMSSNFVLHQPESNPNPNLYSKLYAEMAAKFGGRVEVRVGYNSQDLPVFVRMFDKFSKWGHSNGLKSLIPNALQLSITGYYFILPDMIGGNNYDTLSDLLPEKELYVRWLEANAFLPVIQLSIPPWDYDDEVVTIAKKMLAIHKRYYSYILSLAREAIADIKPIIRPLWWIAPDDTDALRSDTQFLVGDDILVAPVLEKGKNRRDIYLPQGKWMDIQRDKTYEGSQWLFDYDAPLSFLPYFIRQT